MSASERNIEGQDSWLLENDTVRLAVTKRGGMMAPVTFFHSTAKPFQPYHISPWQKEGLRIDEPVLVPLRGDFFCLPFGGGGTLGGRVIPTHGEPATGLWGKASIGRSAGIARLETRMNVKNPAGKVTKRIFLLEGQPVVYIQHTLEGFSARVPLGHHATLGGGEASDRWLISTSPLQFGAVNPAASAPFEDGEYRSLAAGRRFTSLKRVPTVWKDPAFDTCDSFPRRPGFCDIVQVFSKTTAGPSWTAAVAPGEGYVWFSLKDAAVLPSTVFWMENYGRHGAPWSGRNCCIGLEEVCSYFAHPQAASARKNELNDAGVATAVRLTPSRPLSVNCIHGAAKVPRGFDRVKSMVFRRGSMELRSESGKKVSVALHHSFIFSGTLEQ